MTELSRRIALLLGFGVAAAIASHPAPAQTYQGQSLQVAVYGGGTGKAVREAVTGPFEQRTGARIAWSEGGPQEFIAQLAGAKGGTPPFDVIMIEDAFEPQAIAQGLLVKPDYARMPSAKLLMTGAIPPSGYGPAWCYIRLGLGVLPDKLQAAGIALPQDLSVIFDPRLAGHVSLPDVTQTNWDNIMPTIAAFLHTPLDDPAPTLAKLATIKDVSLYNSSSDLEARMSSGEIWVSLWTDGRVYGLKFKGIPIQFRHFAIPDGKGGTYNYTANKTMLEITNPAKKALAEDFIDTYLSTPVATKISLAAAYPPTNQDALHVVQADPKIGPIMDTELNREYQVDVGAWEKVRDRWVDAWGKAMRH